MRVVVSVLAVALCLGSPLAVAAAEPSFDEAKQASLVDVQGEVRLLTEQLERIARVTPTAGGANPAFARARQVFEQKVAVLEGKLAALRATPSDASQSAMADVDTALAAVRAAYAQAVDTAN